MMAYLMTNLRDWSSSSPLCWWLKRMVFNHLEKASLKDRPVGVSFCRQRISLLLEQKAFHLVAFQSQSQMNVQRISLRSSLEDKSLLQFLRDLIHFFVCLFHDPVIDKAVWDARTWPISISAADVGQRMFDHARRQSQCLASHLWHNSWVNWMAEEDPSQTETYSHQVSGRKHESWLFQCNWQFV